MTIDHMSSFLLNSRGEETMTIDHMSSFLLNSKRAELIIVYSIGHASLDLLWSDHENWNPGSIENLLCDTCMEPAIYALSPMGSHSNQIIASESTHTSHIRSNFGQFHQGLAHVGLQRN